MLAGHLRWELPGNWGKKNPTLTALFTTLLTVELYFSNVLHGNYVCTW